MPKFDSDQAQRKWESLANSAGTSLTAVVQGRATTADYSRVASVLNGLNSLAANTFAQAVSAAEVEAKKFQTQYGKLLKEEQKLGDQLTAFELAVNEKLQEIAPNLIESIREIIEMTTLESNEDLTRTIGTRFDDLTTLFPQDPPSVTDLLTANDLLAERLAQQEQAQWDKREPSLIEKIAGAFQSTLRDLAETINRERAARAQGGQVGFPRALPAPASNVPVRYRAPTQQIPRLGRPTIVDMATPLLGGPAAQKAAAPSLAPPTDKTSNSTVVQLSSAAEDKIVEAAKEQTNLYQKLADFLGGKGSPGSPDGGGQAQDQDDEEKKADTWWRSFKNWFGDKQDKYDKFKKDNEGWISTLASGLLLMMFNPQLFKTLGDTIAKYVTFDNLKKVVTSAWDWVADKSKDVLNWAVDKLLHKKEDTVTQKDVDNVRKEPAAALTPDAKKRIDSLSPEDKATFDAHANDFKDRNPNAKLPPPKPGTTMHQSWQSKVANWLGFTNGADTVKLAGSSTEVRNHANVDNGSTSNNSSSSVADQSVGSNRSSVTSNNTSNSAFAFSVPASPMKNSDGQIVIPATSGSSPTGTPGIGDTRAAKGAPQMGMGSFGFTTGISDHLPMMNTAFFTG